MGKAKTWAATSWPVADDRYPYRHTPEIVWEGEERLDGRVHGRLQCHLPVGWTWEKLARMDAEVILGWKGMGERTFDKLYAAVAYVMGDVSELWPRFSEPELLYVVVADSSEGTPGHDFVEIENQHGESVKVPWLPCDGTSPGLHRIGPLRRV